MIIKEIYKYNETEDSVKISLNKPDNIKFEVFYRIIAEKGFLLTIDGLNKVRAVDTLNIDGWYEIEDPNFVEEIEENQFS